MNDVLARHGITRNSLAKHLKAELKAKVSKTAKLKGAVSDEALKAGVKKVAETGVIIHSEDGGQDYGDGDTLITWSEIAWDVRQRARMDAQKLLDMYPAEKHEHGGKGGGPIPVQITDMPPKPKTIDEWLRQVEEAEKNRLERQRAAEEDKGTEENAAPGQS